jgi:hypothetical protein
MGGAPDANTAAEKGQIVPYGFVSNETFTLFGLDQRNPRMPCNKNRKCAIGSLLLRIDRLRQRGAATLCSRHRRDGSSRND